MTVPTSLTRPRSTRLAIRLRAAAAHLPYALGLLAWVVVMLTLFDMVGFLTSDDEHTYGFFGRLTFQLEATFLYFAPVVLIMVMVSELATDRGAARLAWLVSALLLSTLAGVALERIVPDADDNHSWQEQSQTWITILFPAGLLLAIYEFHRKEVLASESALRLHFARIELDAELSKARLQALRAQIEPHFLFNTLANVRRLYQLDAEAGAAMLESLISYLAVALPGLRSEHNKLREEALLIRAYLDIHRIRMGPRLAYEIAFPAELLDATVPSMMLLTLVENAIKHGLAPLPEGGYLRISADARDDTLELRVADSGAGMSAGSGHGTGLANIRARLTGIYGDAARLSLALNRPRGVTATITLPVLMEPAQ